MALLKIRLGGPLNCKINEISVSGAFQLLDGAWHFFRSIQIYYNFLIFLLLFSLIHVYAFPFL